MASCNPTEMGVAAAHLVVYHLLRNRLFELVQLTPLQYSTGNR